MTSDEHRARHVEPHRALAKLFADFVDASARVAISRAVDSRAMEAKFGFRPSAARTCPRVVAGKLCQSSQDDRCLCQRYSRLLDHGRIWLDRASRHVLTAEPYHLISAQELAAFEREVEGLGLELIISGGSLWCPGSAFLLMVVARSRESP